MTGSPHPIVNSKDKESEFLYTRIHYGVHQWARTMTNCLFIVDEFTGLDKAGRLREKEGRGLCSDWRTRHETKDEMDIDESTEMDDGSVNLALFEEEAS